MAVGIGRREFISLIGSAAAWPFAARAQQSAMPVVGFLNSTYAKLYEFNVAAFRQGLQNAGYVEGSNLRIEYRWAEGDYNRLRALAAELVDRQVNVIAATGDVASALAAQAATAKIPIVFTIGGDPVRFGLVASFNRPGGNVTGISAVTGALGAKRMELLSKLAPRSKIGLLMNPDNPNAAAEQRDAQEAARVLGLQTVVLNVRNTGDFDTAFETFVREKAGALYGASDPMMVAQRDQLTAFAARQRVPAIYSEREAVIAGGLMSYGASITGMYRQAGDYVGQILKGAKPAELPVVQPTKFELVINLKTAKALGLEIPATLLATADEVIE
jgi:putative tryptophan/tyrosine transport system substrate-binding protein